MLNDKIRQLRKSRKLNQVELGKALGVTKQCISNWENDNIMPSVDMLMRLADYFSVTTDFLLRNDNRTYIEVTGLTEEQREHIQLLINDIICISPEKTTEKEDN